MNYKTIIAVIAFSFFMNSFAEDSLAIAGIDGMTSASKEFKIVKGTAFETYATITWNDNYSDGTKQVIKYGTTASYGTEINLKPFTANKDITTKIQNLTQNTTYYAQFYRTYGSNTISNVDFTFKTCPKSLEITIDKANKNFSVEKNFITIKGREILLSGNMSPGAFLEITDLQGKSLVKKNITGEKGSVQINGLSRGIYIVRFIIGSDRLSKKIVLGF